MSASEEKIDSADGISVHLLPTRLGIIAGGGRLPARLVESCEALNIDVFIVALEGHTDPALVQGRFHIWARLGAVGTVIKALQDHALKDLVLIGSVRRPGMAELMPDAKALAFLSKAGLKAFDGDDALLGALRGFLEDEGFALHGVHKFVQDLLTPLGVLGKVKPSKEHQQDIARGFAVSQALGALDVGQAVVVQEGLVLGVEAIEGTDQLLERCASLKRRGRGGVLVKSCKPQQDRDLDLPTIGLTTLKLAQQSGLAGVALHAGQSLILDLEEIIAFANAHKLFIIGVEAGL
jgi:DUF1009 family protein